MIHEKEPNLDCLHTVFEGSVGVPSTLITLSMELKEHSGRRVGWTAIGPYAVHTHYRASTSGMSISKRLAALEWAQNMNLVVSQRRKVLKRSEERMNFGRCLYVVTGLASPGNQWEGGLSRISEVTANALSHYWHSCVTFVSELSIFYIFFFYENENLKST